MSRDKDAVARELLAMRCRRGDRMALEELIRTWERPLLYFIRRLVHDEADAWDVLQKTWVKVLSGISSLDDPRSLAPSGSTCIPVHFRCSSQRSKIPSRLRSLGGTDSN